jgi:hypothetical protein
VGRVEREGEKKGKKRKEEGKKKDGRKEGRIVCDLGCSGTDRDDFSWNSGEREECCQGHYWCAQCPYHSRVFA